MVIFLTLPLDAGRQNVQDGKFARIVCTVHCTHTIFPRALNAEKIGARGQFLESSKWKKVFLHLLGLIRVLTYRRCPKDWEKWTKASKELWDRISLMHYHLLKRAIKLKNALD